MTLVAAMALIVIVAGALWMLRCKHPSRYRTSDVDLQGRRRRWLVCEDCGHRIRGSWDDL